MFVDCLSTPMWEWRKPRTLFCSTLNPSTCKSACHIGGTPKDLFNDWMAEGPSAPRDRERAESEETRQLREICKLVVEKREKLGVGGSYKENAPTTYKWDDHVNLCQSLNKLKKRNFKRCSWLWAMLPAVTEPICGDMRWQHSRGECVVLSWGCEHEHEGGREIRRKLFLLRCPSSVFPTTRPHTPIPRKRRGNQT